MSQNSNKAYHEDGGDSFVIDNGGTLDIKTGGQILANGTQGAALTAQSTTLTPASAPGTPDYAIADPVNSNAYGFTTADEFKTVMAVIVNLQARLAEVEARLEGVGLVAAN